MSIIQSRSKKVKVKFSEGMRMSLSSEITAILMRMLEEDGAAEIQRNEFAQELGCVPSQINYVISSRFTPEHGYIVESRRGGGGYIKISRVSLNGTEMIMHAVNSIGASIDSLSARAFIINLARQNLIKEDCARLMLSAVSDNALRPLEREYRDSVRASLLKQMLITSAQSE